MPASPQPVGRLGLAALSLGFGVVQLDVSAVNVAADDIQSSLGGGIESVQWVINAYTVAFAACILTAGTLGDRLGSRRVFAAAFALFTAASAACAATPTIGLLIAARTVQGLAAAGLVPCSLALLNHTFSGDRRARAVGVWAAGASVAYASGPLLGGALTEAAGWRAIFLINVPLGLLALRLTLTRLQETPRAADQAIDVPGQIAVLLALGLFTASLVQSGTSGVGSPAVLAGLAISVAAAVTFLAIEHVRRHPMLPLPLVRTRAFSVPTLLGLLVNVPVYGLVFALSLSFQQDRGWSALLAGAALLPLGGVVLVANLKADDLAGRTGTRTALTGALGLVALGVAAVLTTSAGTSYLVLAVALVALGGGLGLVVPLLTTLVLSSVEADRSGLAAATLNAARQTGSAIGIALFGALLQHGLFT